MRVYFLLLVTLIFASCSSTKFVEPLEKGEQAVGINFGGPVIDYSGASIPLPLSTVYYGNGIDSNITVWGEFHTTSLVFMNLQTNLGATIKVKEQENYIPNISLSPSLNILKDLDDPLFKIWPQLDANLYWNVGKKKNVIYTGLNNYLELSKTRVHQENQIQRLLWSPQIGYNFKFGKSMQANIEMKLLAPNRRNVEAFIPWKSILGTQGGTGIYIGIMKKF